MSSDQIRESYLRDVTYFRNLELKEERLLVILSVLRLVTFIAGLIIIWVGFSVNIISGISVALLVIAIFLYLLKLYSVHSRKRELLGNHCLINQNEANAISGDLSAFDGGSSYTDPSHDFSNDIDLFGDASLFQYLNRTITVYGRDILAGWLSDPYLLTPELVSRQQAIKELATLSKWRHEFMACGLKKTLDKRQIISLLEWTDEKPLLDSSSVQKFLIYFLPAAAILSLTLLALGLIQYQVFTFIVLVNLFYTAAGLKKINRIHDALSRKYNFLASMYELLKVFENESFSSEILNDIKVNITGDKDSAVVSVNKLGKLIQAFDTRMNIFAGFLLNGLLLWDYHSVYRLEKWKSEYRNLFPIWLNMLGQIDAYISLGNYAGNNPGFAYPSLSGENIVFSAMKMGHQLISEEMRVCNDFTVEQRGTLCIISGANMAGKSTFLRTVAVNYLLGMCGAPVCANELNFTPLRLFTSMRTVDSLSHNESYFYAELKRLKTLKTRVESGEPLLFILDEILKGTNSADKSMGSKLFLIKMVELGATGLVATHDTTVGGLADEYPAKIVNKCFEIEIKGETISFDYKLHDGITNKMNAALLMKQMGILD